MTTLFRLVDLLGNPPEWQELALCREVDGDLFFPDLGSNAAPAKRICAQCEVREPCLEWALERGERFGVYGGKSERERRKLKRRAA